MEPAPNQLLRSSPSPFPAPKIPIPSKQKDTHNFKHVGFTKKHAHRQLPKRITHAHAANSSRFSALYKLHFLPLCSILGIGTRNRLSRQSIQGIVKLDTWETKWLSCNYRQKSHMREGSRDRFGLLVSCEEFRKRESCWPLLGLRVALAEGLSQLIQYKQKESFKDL